MMRCLALAEHLSASGMTCRFLSRSLPEHWLRMLNARGFESVQLPGDSESIDWQADAIATIDVLKRSEQAEWLLVDHYGLGLDWEIAIRPHVRKLAVMDDSVSRLHGCDVLMNTSVFDEKDTALQRLSVPAHCKLLLGPAYSLLRQEFRRASGRARSRDGTILRVLVSFGGSDPCNLTAAAVQALEDAAFSTLHIDVVAGASNPRKEEVKELCAAVGHVEFHEHTERMAELMVRADLGIGSAGSTSWERCYLGLPSIVITAAANQYGIGHYLHRRKAAIHLGWHQFVSSKQLRAALHALIADPAATAAMSVQASALMDGCEGRVAELVQHFMNE